MNTKIALRPAMLALATLTIASLTIASLAVADQPWSAFRGPGATGVSSESLPPGDGPLALELVWKRPLGSGYAGISIADGFLVTGFSDGERDIVGAFDPQTGEELWRYDLAPIYIGHDGSHNGTIATPAIAAGRVFMSSPWGQLVALDLETGEALWTMHLIDDLGGEKPLYGFAASPLVIGDAVVVSVCGDGESIVALDVASGETRWRAFEAPCMGSQGSPILMEVFGQPQVIVLGQTRLVGLEAAVPAKRPRQLPTRFTRGASGSTPQSGIHRRGGVHVGARHWRHHRDFQRSQLGSSAPASLPCARTPGPDGRNESGTCCGKGIANSRLAGIGAQLPGLQRAEHGFRGHGLGQPCVEGESHRRGPPATDRGGEHLGISVFHPGCRALTRAYVASVRRRFRLRGSPGSDPLPWPLGQRIRC